MHVYLTISLFVEPLLSSGSVRYSTDSSVRPILVETRYPERPPVTNRGILDDVKHIARLDVELLIGGGEGRGNEKNRSKKIKIKNIIIQYYSITVHVPVSVLVCRQSLL